MAELGKNTTGDFLREALENKGWTQTDLSKIVGRPVQAINEIIQGKKSVTAEMAIALGMAFDELPEVWMQREAAYRLSLAKSEEDELVRKRARLYELAPIKEIQRRGWIKTTEDAVELEGELLRFFGIDSLDDEPPLFAAFRKSDEEESASAAQRAWCFRAHALASSQVISRYQENSLDECFRKLRKLAAFAPQVGKVAKVLADHGIRFVVIEPLSGTRIDGAAFWVDGDMDKPCVAVSIRFDRIDAFWFTLFHELIHIKHKDALSVDVELVGEHATPSIAKTVFERRADKEAAEALIPPDKMESFIHRIAPLYSKERIIQFAHVQKIHPGIIVGQLQHRGQIGFHANREMLVKIRHIAISTAIVDGWGNTIS